MLEKIGLPSKPSLRGNNWVIDASHCQGCSSQFTFINRKHHCRRCGGIFCNSCTQQRMNLRGQGDSPVRICEPCKKLEEAARFELRHGHKSRTARGSSRSISKPEDDILAEILGSDRKESSSSVQESSFSAIERATSGVRSSKTQEFDKEGEACSSFSDNLENKMESSSPEELRQQALDEKKKYKILKGEGKSEEALKSFKRGKELERKADALEIYIRKSRKKSLISGNAGENHEKGSVKESGRKMKLSPQMSKEKPDLNAELRELGWSDMELHGDDKKTATMSLEGELSSLLGEVFQKTDKDKNVHSIDNTQVLAHKRKALVLKREGKLAEAKEELKKAKVLERQLEEQELLAGAEESDDELSALVRSLDADKQEDISFNYKGNLDFDLDNLLGAANNINIDFNFEVTDEDIEDPEMAAALETLGWTEDSNNTENIVSQPLSGSRESVNSEIVALKREALKQKRAGNTAVAMEQLKKAKMLERDLENFGSQEDSFISGGGNVEATEVINPKLPLKNKFTIQKELLAIKKRALVLRREGRLDEAEQELNKGKVLEHQLEELAGTLRGNGAEVSVGVESNDPHLVSKHLNRNLPDVEVVEDVTDQEMHDPEYLSVLKNLGWNDKDDQLVPSKPSKQDNLPPVHPSQSSANRAPNYSVMPVKRSKTEIQRELLGLKRKALSLRRQGDTDGADEVLLQTKALEAEMEEIENRVKARTDSTRNQVNVHEIPSGSVVEEGNDGDVTEEDMNDPTLLSVLQNLGWNNDEEPVNKQQVKSTKESASLTVNQSYSEVTALAPQKRSEIQREILNLKRKALALRRKGEVDEAEEVLRRAKGLEIQMDEQGAPKPTTVLDAAEDDKSVSQVSEQVALSLKEEVTDLSTGLRISKDGSIRSHLQNFDHSDRLNFKQSEVSLREVGASDGNNALEGKTTTEDLSSSHQPGQNRHTIDLLTGNNWSSHKGTREQNDILIFHSDVFSKAGPSIEYVQTTSPVPNKDHFSIRKHETVVHTNRKQHDQENSSSEESSSMNSQSSPRQEILARKKKAVALKREGKMSEAREELRQAKLLEKSLEESNGQPQLSSKDLLTPRTEVQSVDQNAYGSSSTVEQKPMSSRDRFKLQQESLGHKRQALKFRREGRIQEAESEFEKAKAIETKLEGLTDSTKSSIDEESAGDVSIEDFLDPQLLSALKAIGLEDHTASRSQEIQKPPKVQTGKVENTDLERSQLEERIKAEKVKAVNLKRVGKQAEALDALRRAKLHEKKLNSMTLD